MNFWMLNHLAVDNSQDVQADGRERTILLKASGYYDIHLDAGGEPQTEIIEKMDNEPGFTVQFALKEYLKWEAEN